MKIAKSQKEAEALNPEHIFKDSDTSYRCYMPGEIQRPEVAEAPEEEVSMLAFRHALTRIGLRKAVEDYVAAAPIEVRDEWTLRKTVRRHNELIVGAGKALGQSDEALDALFGLAKQIEATL